MCKDPCIPKVDVLQEFASSVAAGVAGIGRVTVRVATRWFDDNQLDYGRRVLCWRFMLELVVAAVTVYWLGRSAMWVFAGAAAGSWWLGRSLLGEQRRRSLRLERARPAVCQSPVTANPEVDAELEQLAAGQVPCGECAVCLADRQEVPV